MYTYRPFNYFLISSCVLHNRLSRKRGDEGKPGGRDAHSPFPNAKHETRGRKFKTIVRVDDVTFTQFTKVWEATRVMCVSRRKRSRRDCRTRAPNAGARALSKRGLRSFSVCILRCTQLPVRQTIICLRPPSVHFAHSRTVFARAPNGYGPVDGRERLLRSTN